MSEFTPEPPVQPGAAVPPELPSGPTSPFGPNGLPPAGPNPPRRNGWKIAFIVVAIVLGLALIGAVAWGVLTAKAPSPAPAPTVTVTISPSPTPTATSTPTPTPTNAASTACTADQLSVTLGQAEGTAGSSVVPLVFTNTGTTGCTLQGYPQIAFVGDDNGTQLGAAAVPDENSAVASLELAPGGAAQALLQIATASNFPNCSVQTANGFRVFPPNASGAIFVPTTAYDACTNTSDALLRVGAVTTVP